MASPSAEDLKRELAGLADEAAATRTRLAQLREKLVRARELIGAVDSTPGSGVTQGEAKVG